MKKAKRLPCKYDNVWPFSKGFAIVELDGKCGFVDEQGEEVVPCKYDDSGWFSEGFAEVELDGKWGFVNKQGEEVFPASTMMRGVSPRVLPRLYSVANGGL